MAREAIWAALFARLKTSLQTDAAPLLVTLGRVHVAPPTLALEMQPAGFLVPIREERKPRPAGFGGTITLTGFFILYFQTPYQNTEPIGQETLIGAITLNNILDAVDAAFEPDSIANGKLTLGGLVQHCWIEGDVDVDPGIYGSQGSAIVPVKILVVL